MHLFPESRTWATSIVGRPPLSQYSPVATSLLLDSGQVLVSVLTGNYNSNALYSSQRIFISGIKSSCKKRQARKEFSWKLTSLIRYSRAVRYSEYGFSLNLQHLVILLVLLCSERFVRIMSLQRALEGLRHTPFLACCSEAQWRCFHSCRQALVRFPICCVLDYMSSVIWVV
jgi:hypothetical protein